MSTSHHDWTDLTLQWVLEGHNERLPTTLTEAISQATGAELERLFRLLAAQFDTLAPPESSQASPGSDPAKLPQTPSAARLGALGRLRPILQLTAARVLSLRLSQEGQLNSATPLDASSHTDPSSQPAPSIDPEILDDLASRLALHNLPATAHCLQILAAQGDSRSLRTLCEFLKRQTLEDEQSVAVALSPLFQWPPPGLSTIYQVLGEDVWRWELLGGLLDLAGHSLRKGRLKAHPLAAHAARLRELLNSTTARLSRLEANPQQYGDDVATIQRVLNNAIALTVSLCDSLGLMGDQQAEKPLAEAMELSHRRIQTEAAGALARLGNAAGLAKLKEMVQDPASRLRALAYVDEMNIDDATMEDWRQPVALAEAEVVCWLADPQRFGVPPAELELIDERSQYWPSYEDPQACFLYRFTYHFSQGELSNLIIGGPLVHAFQADLRRLEVDDVYAIFAGWQAEHPDIYEVPRANFNPAQYQDAERLLSDASLDPAADGVEDLQILALTFFFGERAVLAVGQRAGQPVGLVSDGLESLARACDNRPTGLTPDLILNLYRGRKLLRSFNP